MKNKTSLLCHLSKDMYKALWLVSSNHNKIPRSCWSWQYARYIVLSS